MPEIIEISGLDQMPEPQAVNGEDDLLGALLAVGLLLGGAFIVHWLLPKPSGDFMGLGELGIIMKCRKQDRKADRPVSKQRWCLWDSKMKKILGRHSTKESALRQERLIQLKKKGVL